MKRLFLLAAVAALITACAPAPDCSADAGFETGLAGQPPEAECTDTRYVHAYRLGHALEEMRSERDALLAREDELEAIERARLRVLERDLPELETLARIEGLLPPGSDL